MKAAVVRATGSRFETAEIDIAQPLGREVLVDVRASGLCHTDYTFVQHDAGLPLPAVFGHEAAGVVAAVGPDVTQLAAGDHVVACLVPYCGVCVKCLSGRVYECLHPEVVRRGESTPPRLSEGGGTVYQGFGIGGFAQQTLIHENQLVKIPDAVPFPQAALLGCGVVTGAGAVLNTADVQAGAAVVVVGAGGVGLNVVSGAVVAGAATIIAVDIADDKLDKARSFGATHVINSRSTDPVEAVLKITGRGADAVFDVVGIEQATRQALAMVGPGGGLYLIGVLDPTLQIPVNLLDFIRTQRRVQGVNMGSTNPKRDIPLYAQLYLEGRFELDSLVSKTISLDEINEGYVALEDSAVTRVVISSL